ncbi:hypothetical protein IFR04_006162 [Cadophora malorum]|uniref:Heterokaryon incompatibility domain-containing protein n=1 Tax=Cadophora malorum TaxID=108018 RepID=A0A8H7WBE5_9HELO|nr:hypothetical protein IFR04_006162 [Cadophora malorum]
MPIYHPLPSTGQGPHIRLCSLLPASFGTPIKCNIQAFELDPQLEYEAVSYVWGNEIDCISIEVNGERMLVRKNLATLLTYLRTEFDYRSLWIDAICINQADTVERNGQVLLMGEIYRSASRVISWLGIRDTFFDPFVEMQYATILFHHIRFLNEHRPFQEYLENHPNQDPYDDFEEHKKTLDHGLYSLQLLIGERERERPTYWNRSWIIQEVASAKKLILQSGSYTISEDDIELVTEFISSSNVALLMNGRYEQRKFSALLRYNTFIPISIYRTLVNSNNTSNKNYQREPVRKQGPMDLLALLRHNRSRSCANPKDKVYSVLGISAVVDGQPLEISVDYNKSTSEVYTDAVRAIISASRTLDVLCSVNLAETAQLPALPSWVPNWSAYKSPESCDRSISFKHQQATGSAVATINFWNDGTGSFLSVTGFCFGSVLDLKDPFVRFETDEAIQDRALAQLINYTLLQNQLSQAYKEMSKLLYPKPLPADVFRQTCSLGLLHHDLNDSFREIMDNLELDPDMDKHASNRPLELPENLFSYNLMASSINGKCMLAVKQTPLMESTRFSQGIVGIAPPGIVQKDDLVCLLLGCSAPIILRPVANRYVVVCAAYIDGLMDGSAMIDLEDGFFSLKMFILK